MTASANKNSNNSSNNSPTNNFPIIGVMILNWNAWQDTLVCLASLMLSEKVNLYILIVDNGSSNESVVKIKQWLSDRKGMSRHQVRLLQLDRNYGFAGGCNRGLAELENGELSYYVVLNNDLKLNSDAIRKMYDTAINYESELIGAKVYDAKGESVLYQGRKLSRPFLLRNDLKNVTSDASLTDHVEGSCMMISQRLLSHRKQNTGYIFDENMFLYCEDLDLSLYAKSRGFKAMVAQTAFVKHGVSKSSGGAGNPRSYYYITRNRVFIANRWLKLWEKILFHLYYISSRPIRALWVLITGNSAAAQAILVGLVHAYKGVGGKRREN